MTRISSALAFVVLYPAASIAQQSAIVSRDVPAGVDVTRDIVYVEYGDRRLRLDLYRPDDRSDAALPVIVAIRGGGVQIADKEGFAHVAAALAARGFAAVSIEYRPALEAGFPAAVEDAYAAVRWARANAQVYGFDSDAIGAIGGSMGGFLASYLALAGDAGEIAGSGENASPASAISAVVAMAPPTNFEAMQNHSALIAVLGVEFADDPGRWRSASPASHVSPSSPPALLVHSATDGAVPVDQSIELARLYAAANRPVELVVLSNAEHAFWNYEAWFDDTMDRAAWFFDEHLD